MKIDIIHGGNYYVCIIHQIVIIAVAILKDIASHIEMGIAIATWLVQNDLPNAFDS